MTIYAVDSIGRVSLRNVSRKTLDKYYFRTQEKYYIYKKARFAYDPLNNTFGFEGAKRKNRRSGRKQYLWVRAEPSRKKEIGKYHEVVVQGNVVSMDRTETGNNVYLEGYVKGNVGEEQIANSVFAQLDMAGYRLFRSKDGNDRISVNFVEKPKGKMPVYSLKDFSIVVVDEVKNSMHPARKFEGSHHAKRERTEHKAFVKEWEGD